MTNSSKNSGFAISCIDNLWYVKNQKNQSVKMFVNQNGNVIYDVNNNSSMKIIMEGCLNYKEAKALLKIYVKKKFDSINSR